MSNHSRDCLLDEVYEKSKKAFLYMGLFSFFVNILMLTVPIYMMQVFDRVLAGHHYQTLVFLTLIALFALLVLSALDMVRGHIAMRVASWYERKLSPAALLISPDRILHGSDYPHMVLKDVVTLRQFIGGTSLFTFFDAPWVPVYLIVISMIAPTLGLVAVIGAILLFSCAILNEILTRDLQAKANDLGVQNTFATSNSLRHAEVIQAMGMLLPLIRRWQQQADSALDVQEQCSHITGIIYSVSKFIRLALQVLVLGFGAYLVVLNEITGGMMIAASILTSKALAPVEQSIGAWRQFQSCTAALRRLKQHFQFMSGRQSGIQLPKPKGMLTLENLFYSPGKPGAKPVIHGVSLHINPGEMIALIGPSGSGKTTLVRLISGILKPSSGIVRLDSADVYHWDRHDLGPHIGYLPQDIDLFAGSIKANIARMGEIDDLAVVKAAQQAGCHDMILHFPQGYETEIQSGGGELSGGQRQRVGLARALYGEPQLVILDEPNSNLDNAGEEALLQAFQSLKKRGATVIIVAHRPSILTYVDKIVVLSEGRVQMVDARDKVLTALTRIPSGQQKQQGN